MTRSALTGLAAALMAAAPLAAPATAQTPAVMQDWSTKEMAGTLSDLQVERIAEGRDTRDGVVPFVQGRIGGAIVRVAGSDCHGSPALRCGSADFMSDFTFASPADADKAMTVLAYDVLAVLRIEPTRVRLHRNVLLSGGVTRDNLRGNAMLFVTTLFDAQNKLREAKLMDEPR